MDDSALMPKPGAITQYVIYDHPRDHPGYFVVRPWDIENGVVTPRLVAAQFNELAAARAWCEQLELVCIGRTSADDPTILEVWT